jgi:type I restriction enzyme M protein
MRPIAAELLHALRGGGLSNPMSALEQLSLLLLLRYVDGAAWSELLRNPDRYSLLREPLFADVLQKSPVGGPALRHAMRGTTFAFPSPELLQVVLERLDQMPDGPYVCADLLDAALDEVSASSAVGSPRTPSRVSECMLGLTGLRPGDFVFDPAAGAGDRLLAAIRWTTGSSPQMALSVEGAELDATMMRLGALSLVFHGVAEPRLYTRNVLSDPPEADADFDVILCQPPFGNRIARSMLAPEFRDLPSVRSELLFAELVLSRLAPHGRAVIVLPANATFGRPALPLRRRLLERLRAVVALPQGTFAPHTNVETFLVAIGGDPTQDVAFIDSRKSESEQDAQELDILQRSGAIVDDLLYEGLSVEGLRSEDRGRVLVVSKTEIAERDFSLLSSTYLPEDRTVAVQDSPLMLLREIQAAQSEIDQYLLELGKRLARRSSKHG